MIRQPILLFLFLLAGCLRLNAQNQSAHFTSFPQYYRCGDIAIQGTQLTVEALVKLDGTGPYGVGQPSHDIVSKHRDDQDVAYLLRPDHCELTTSNGYFFTPSTLSHFSRDSFYHVAMTYNGAQLNFYVNGCLYSSVAATGSLVSNSYPTTIGQLAFAPTATNLEQLIGYTDEVRIWSVARTQAQIRANMKDLPSYATETGLLAYYKFEGNSLNVQGNAAFNAIPFNAPQIQVQNGFSAVKPFSPVFNVFQPGCNANVGTINVQPIGGNGPFSYYLNGVLQSSNTFGSLPAGTYQVSVRSAGNACQKDTTIVLTDPCAPVADPCSGIQVSLGSAAAEKGYDIAVSTDNNLFVAGVSNSGGNDNILVTKITPAGNVIWSKTFGGPGTESVRKISATADGGLLLTGQTKSFSNSAGEMLCMKVSATGSLVWTRKFNQSSANGELGMDIIETPDGGVVATGIINVAGVVADALVIRMNSAATVLWTKRLNNANGEDGVGIVLKGDTLVFAADMQETTGQYSFSITKLRLSDGAIVTAKKFIPWLHGFFNPYLYRNPAQPGYIVSGHHINGTSYADMKHAMITLDEGLNVIGTGRFELGPATNDFFTGLVPLADGSMIGCASSPVGSDGYIYRISASNQLSYLKRYNATTDRRLYRLVKRGEEIYAVGWASVNGQEDLLVVSFNQDGSSVASCSMENWNGLAATNNVTPGNLTWNSVTTPVFANTMASLTEVDLPLNRTELCPGRGLDFSYQQNACDPRNVQFMSSLAGYGSFQWSFGNGQINTTSATPSVNYASHNTYTVKLVAQRTAGCPDSVSKPVLVQVLPDPALISTADTVICPGDSVKLATSEFFGDSCWTASVPLLPLATNVYVHPVSNTTYGLTAQVLGANLLGNPTFSQGNQGFLSTYTHVPLNTGDQQYFIGAVPIAWNTQWGNCGDHTSGTGMMLMARTGGQAGERIWYQTVNVTPNTSYRLSAWFTTLGNTLPAPLEFTINNISLGKQVSFATGTNCQWNQSSLLWNSGNNTTATLAIATRPGAVSGGAVAIDDLFFGTVTYRSDSLNVVISPGCDSIALTGPATVCDTSATIDFYITRAANCPQQYNLTVDPAKVEVVAQSPAMVRLRFKQAGTASIIASIVNNCSNVADTLVVDVKPSPALLLTPDLVLCRDTSLVLQAGAPYASYQWQNGSNQPSFAVSSAGLYHVAVTDYCGRVTRDSFVLTRTVPVPFQYSPATVSVCQGDSVQFTASGGTGYSWQPASVFSAPSAATTRALVASSQPFTLSITDAVCQRDTSLTIVVTAAAHPDIQVFKQNDLNCFVDTAVLNATGALSYTWLPAAAVIRQGNGQVTVRPQQTTTFLVTGTDAAGCKGTDSVTVYFNRTGDQKLYLPNAFTPNRDGLNDLFTPRLTGQASKFMFRVYNRWGQLLFQTAQAGKGWDGTFQNKLQPQDTYVFYITAEGACGGVFEQKGGFVLIR